MISFDAERVHIFFAYLMFLSFTVLLIFFIPMIFDIKEVVGFIPPQLSFTNQMFITGYFIYGFMLTMVITSYFRYRLKYEIFYNVHHLFIGLFLLWIFHTLGKFRLELNQCYRKSSSSEPDLHLISRTIETSTDKSSLLDFAFHSLGCAVVSVLFLRSTVYEDFSLRSCSA